MCGAFWLFLENKLHYCRDFERTRARANELIFTNSECYWRQTLQRISALKCKRCSHWWRQGQWQTDAYVFAWTWAFEASTQPWDCEEHSSYLNAASVPSATLFCQISTEHQNWVLLFFSPERTDQLGPKPCLCFLVTVLHSYCGRSTVESVISAFIFKIFKLKFIYPCGKYSCLYGC